MIFMINGILGKNSTFIKRNFVGTFITAVQLDDPVILNHHRSEIIILEMLLILFQESLGLVKKVHREGFCLGVHDHCGIVGMFHDHDSRHIGHHLRTICMLSQSTTIIVHNHLNVRLTYTLSSRMRTYACVPRWSFLR